MCRRQKYQYARRRRGWRSGVSRPGLLEFIQHALGGDVARGFLKLLPGFPSHTHRVRQLLKEIGYLGEFVLG
jgi:hypothetical protein